MKDHLRELILEMRATQAAWNGDKSGYQEDQANIATEIIEKANELIDLINEMNGTN